jgi:GT2 family glycosyltransferase
VQDGNDFWNATFFCGSCAVLRREALDEIGGIAVETVTEDAHTSLRMQSNGWNTAYINIPQAAGLATERLSAHVGQRIRWARGMIQILRTDNPLFAPKLNFAQRLCYFNAMAHFLYAAAAIDLSHRAVDLSTAVAHQCARLLGRDSRLRASASHAVQHHQLAHPGPASPFVLERNLRDRFVALHPAANHAGADQPQAG